MMKDHFSVLKEPKMMDLSLQRRTKGVVAPQPTGITVLALLVMFVFAMVLDTFATQFMVTRGFVQEGNPAMALLISDGRFVAFKLTGTLLCAGLLWMVHRRFPRLSLSGVLGSLLVCSAILFWNAAVVAGIV